MFLHVPAEIIVAGNLILSDINMQMFYYKDKDNIFILAIKIIVADNLIESDMCRYSVHGAISL